MKRILLLICAVCFSGLVVRGQAVKQGHAAYNAGDYGAAIGFYESALLQGNRGGDLYFNLGNAYYLNGQLGRAMLNYRRAAVLLPRDGRINRQIAVVRGDRVDRVGAEINSLVILSNLTADYLTLSEVSLIGFGIWCLFFGVLAFGWRRRWQIGIAVIGVLLVIVVSLVGVRVFIETQQAAAVIIDTEIQVLSGPGDTYLTLFSLYEGLELRVLEQRDDWVRIVLPDGRQGWILASSAGYIASGLG